MELAKVNLLEGSRMENKIHTGYCLFSSILVSNISYPELYAGVMVMVIPKLQQAVLVSRHEPNFPIKPLEEEILDNLLAKTTSRACHEDRFVLVQIHNVPSLAGKEDSVSRFNLEVHHRLA